MKTACAAVMLYFLYSTIFSIVLAENMCIDGEIYIEATDTTHNEYLSERATVYNTKLITHPKNGTLKPVGNKLCGFRIEAENSVECYTPVTVKFIAVEVKKRDGSYCTIYDQETICVCDFFACNSLDGILWEIAAMTMIRVENDIMVPIPSGDAPVSLDDRDYAATNCLQRLYEYSRGENITSKIRPNEYGPLFYYRRKNEFRVNAAEMAALKKRSETEFPMPEVCPKSPTPSPPPPAPTCPPPASTVCPVAKSSTYNMDSIFAWIIGARIALWNQL